LDSRRQRFAERLGDLQAAEDGADLLAERTETVIRLAALAKGMDGHRRVALTTYVLRHWFGQVVAAANVRLAVMSSGRDQRRGRRAAGGGPLPGRGVGGAGGRLAGAAGPRGGKAVAEQGHVSELVCAFQVHPVGGVVRVLAGADQAGGGGVADEDRGYHQVKFV